ncbi:MAG TPA: hypothetical protein VHT27_05675 [Solirubrobacteraceae bacterium]|jgi:DnaJ-class molecular chaperone|nr:hypothetical protein [Solirubrobacteraceae bacterium]
MACRGTGRVISNLGGTRSEVPCPWCEGTGQRMPGIDAQARFRAEAGSEGAPRGEDAPAPAEGD